MDDYAIVGLPEPVDEYCKVMLQALELTGFEAKKNWTWNKDQFTMVIIGSGIHTRGSSP